jgi:hypothetical protein
VCCLVESLIRIHKTLGSTPAQKVSKLKNKNLRK